MKLFNSVGVLSLRIFVPIIAPVLAVSAVASLLGCNTIRPEEKAIYDRTPPVQENDLGDRTGVIMKTRSYVTQAFVIRVPKNAKAIVLFFSGRNGMGGNTAKLENSLPEDGIGFANIPPPSDLPNGFASGGRRSAKDHVIDIETVIGYVRRTYGLPIWLAGLSMGTVSVANITTSSRERVDGAVFMSALTSRGTSGGGDVRGETLVTEFPLGRLHLPVLAIAHRDDNCAGTPPSGAREIVALARNAPAAEAKIISGDRDYGPLGCSVGPHTFSGAEDQLARQVIDFIFAHSKAQAAD